MSVPLCPNSCRLQALWRARQSSMPLTSKSKARNKKVHMEIQSATSLQALLEPHETCDLLVPSKASPISLPTPLLLLYEFHWFLCHKGEEKGLSVYQAHSDFSPPHPPHFETLFRNPMQLKCLYLPLFFFFNAIPNSKIFIHSLVSRRKETTKRCTWRRPNEEGVALNEPETEELRLWLL